MPKWRKDQTEFEVGLFHDERRGSMTVVPKPVVEHLGEPDRIVFKIKKNGAVIVE